MGVLDAFTEEKDGMTGTLSGKRIAILCMNGFELLELTEPRKALQDAGAETVLVAPAPGKIKAWNMTNWDGKYVRSRGVV